MNQKCTGVEQILAQEENQTSGEWNFLYIWQNVYRENSMESEGKVRILNVFSKYLCQE